MSFFLLFFRFFKYFYYVKNITFFIMRNNQKKECPNSKIHFDRNVCSLTYIYRCLLVTCITKYLRNGKLLFFNIDLHCIFNVQFFCMKLFISYFKFYTLNYYYLMQSLHLNYNVQIPTG